MVLLKCPSGEVEVRLMRPPSNAIKPIFFDEFAKLGVREAENETSRTRYVSPHDEKYGFHITYKKGYEMGDFNRHYIVLYDASNNNKVCSWGYYRSSKSSSLHKDRVFRLVQKNQAMMDGELRKDVEFSFLPLKTSDSDLVCGLRCELGENSGFGALRLKIGTSKRSGNGQRPIHKSTFFKQLAISASSPSHPEQVEAVDQKSYYKNGVTNKVSLAGGTKVGAEDLEPQYSVKSGDDSVEGIFFCRDIRTFDTNSILKTPILLEFQPWDFLTPLERECSFKKLQEFEKSQLLLPKLAINPNADVKLLDLEVRQENSAILRPWGNLWAFEREGCFKYLQDRRKMWDRGESPKNTTHQERPDGAVLKHQALGNSAADFLPNPVGCRPGNPTPAQVDATSPISRRTAPAIKKEEESNVIRRVHQEIIILDDSDEDIPSPPKKQKTNTIIVLHPAIKTEISDSGDFQKNATVSGSPIHPLIKRESSSQEMPAPQGDDENAELVKLREEIKRQAEELEDAERIAAIRKQKHELQTRLNAMEASRRL